MFLSEVRYIEVAFVQGGPGSLKAVEREGKCVSILTKWAVVGSGSKCGCVWNDC